MNNYTNIISEIHGALLYVYWCITGIIFIIAILLAGLAYANHYEDPELYLFKDFLSIAATLNLDKSHQKTFDDCLKNQDTSKIYPSQIIKSCLSQAGANFTKKDGHYILLQMKK